MRKAEFIGAALFVLLGIHVVQQASLLPYSERYGPGPGFLPFWLGWAWIALAVAHAGNLVLQPYLHPGKQPFPSGLGARRVITVCAILLASVFLLGSVGLLISLLLMLGVLLMGVERLPKRRSLVVTVAVAATFYLLFAVVLGVPFPKSPLGI